MVIVVVIIAVAIKYLKKGLFGLKGQGYSPQKWGVMVAGRQIITLLPQLEKEADYHTVPTAGKGGSLSHCIHGLEAELAKMNAEAQLPVSSLLSPEPQPTESSPHTYDGSSFFS